MLTNRSIVRSVVTGLLMMLCAAGVASAQEISESHMKAALAAVKVASPSAENYDRRLPAASDEVQNILIRGRPDLYQVISEVVNEEALKLAGRRQELDVAMAAVWAEFFTEDELNQIAAFFGSPVGTKYKATVPAMSQKIVATVREWSGKLRDDLFEASIAAMQARGYPM